VFEPLDGSSAGLEWQADVSATVVTNAFRIAALPPRRGSLGLYEPGHPPPYPRFAGALPRVPTLAGP
jgi:hypothetical protein